VIVPASGIDVSFAIPCHNEADSLRELIPQIESQMAASGRTYEIIVADDGSSDGSWDRLRALARTRPHLRGLRLDRNAGESAALYAAISFAQGTVIVTLAADLQNDPADLPKLFAALATADCVCGTRQATRRDGDSWLREVTSHISNAVRAAVLGDPLTDAGCGYRAFRREAFHGIPFFDGVHRFLPVLMAFHGWRVTEVPIVNRARIYGRSHYGVGLLTRKSAVLDLLGVRWLKARTVRFAVRERIAVKEEADK
jgi:glycosyltransferase involved in cell wall biosynthesis